SSLEGAYLKEHLSCKVSEITDFISNNEDIVDISSGYADHFHDYVFSIKFNSPTNAEWEEAKKNQTELYKLAQEIVNNYMELDQELSEEKRQTIVHLTFQNIASFSEFSCGFKHYIAEKKSVKITLNSGDEILLDGFRGGFSNGNPYSEVYAYTRSSHALQGALLHRTT
ncbi:hypothetical protein, partial [Pseudomonas sp. MWU12-2323]|uniref:hypothetical protein n=1 Tax=Pseudomonas sp. MWU12-2323 TaxID=2651296 RepID=UPI001C49A4BA